MPNTSPSTPSSSSSSSSYPLSQRYTYKMTTSRPLTITREVKGFQSITKSWMHREACGGSVSPRGGATYAVDCFGGGSSNAADLFTAVKEYLGASPAGYGYYDSDGDYVTLQSPLEFDEYLRLGFENAALNISARGAVPLGPQAHLHFLLRDFKDIDVFFSQICDNVDAARDEKDRPGTPWCAMYLDDAEDWVTFCSVLEFFECLLLCKTAHLHIIAKPAEPYLLHHWNHDPLPEPLQLKASAILSPITSKDTFSDSPITKDDVEGDTCIDQTEETETDRTNNNTSPVKDVVEDSSHTAKDVVLDAGTPPIANLEEGDTPAGIIPWLFRGMPWQGSSQGLTTTATLDPEVDRSSPNPVKDVVEDDREIAVADVVIEEVPTYRKESGSELAEVAAATPLPDDTDLEASPKASETPSVAKDVVEDVPVQFAFSNLPSTPIVQNSTEGLNAENLGAHPHTALGVSPWIEETAVDEVSPVEIPEDDLPEGDTTADVVEENTEVVPVAETEAPQEEISFIPVESYATEQGGPVGLTVVTVEDDVVALLGAATGADMVEVGVENSAEVEMDTSLLEDREEGVIPPSAPSPKAGLPRLPLQELVKQMPVSVCSKDSTVSSGVPTLGPPPVFEQWGNHNTRVVPPVYDASALNTQRTDASEVLSTDGCVFPEEPIPAGGLATVTSEQKLDQIWEGSQGSSGSFFMVNDDFRSSMHPSPQGTPRRGE